MLTFRKTAPLPSGAIDYIAEVSVPTEITLPKNVQPEDFIRAYCGVLTDTYQNRFLALNLNFTRAPVATARLVTMPACARWRKNAPAEVLQGDTLDKLLLRESGRLANAILDSCDPDEKLFRCDRSLKFLIKALNPKIDLDSLEAGTMLLLPFSSQFTTITLKPEYAANRDMVAEKIAQLSNRAVIPFPSAPVSLVRPLTNNDPDVRDPNCREADSKSPRQWPYDAKLVSDVLTRNSNAVSQRVQGDLFPTVISVLDTGIADMGTAFKLNIFDRNLRERPGNFRDNDRNGYYNDVYGTNALRQGDLDAFDDYQFGTHGTHVTDLVLGGSEFRAQFKGIHKLLRVKIVRLVAPSGGKGKYEMTDSGLVAGLGFAGKFSRVANISVGTDKKIDEISEILRTWRDLVVVVAAGNEHQNLSLKASFPAVYGGEDGIFRDRVITVAAQDAAGRLAEFSNFGRSYTDIAAPGCALIYTDSTGNQRRLFGTSFAAPLVTFTVGLLRTLRVGEADSLLQLKQRLIASADYDPSLEKFVAASGRLNILKAISVTEDVMELQGGDIKFGTWLRPDGDVALCNESAFDPTRVRKITPVSIDTNFRLRILYEDDVGRLMPIVCTASGPGIEFNDRDGNKRLWAWPAIADFVPRYYPPDQ